jgi:hypothetical protein
VYAGSYEERATNLRIVNLKESEECLLAMVIIGFGEYKDFKLQEVPDAFLARLAEDYSLSISAHEDSDSGALKSTIAIHEEVRRRANGGNVEKRAISRKEMASKLLNTAFRHLSKDYHPDREGGDLEAQKVLAEMRDYLLDACKNIPEPARPGALVIHDPNAYSSEISDDDIPF